MDVRIVGLDLPGRTWCTSQNIHVGVQRRAEVVDLFPGDAEEAVWDFQVDASGTDGELRGPYVQGRRGARFLYLSWGVVDADGTFAMFRRAKLMLDALDGETVQGAAPPGRRLLGTLALTGGDGGPLCAAVRPPAISWTAAPAD